MCLSVEGIYFEVAHGISRGEGQCHLDIKLLVGIFSDSRILKSDGLFPGGHNLVLEVLMTGKAVDHIFAESIFEAEPPR